ncbi:MAG: 3-oxoacyl-ACP synthase, partial [Geobacteraceae bacterium]
MIYSQVLATGSGIPERVVPNDFFNYLVEDADNWIFSRTGMRERRFAAPHESTSDLATVAAINALKQGDIDPAELDCIILGTSTADMILPAAASMVQKNIGAVNAFAFDINAVCSSFVYGMEVADNFIRSGKYNKILVIGADTYSKILDFQDQTTCPLFGDGAGAAVLGSTTDKKGILQSIIKSDGKGWELIQVPSSGSRKPITAETITL